MRPPIALAIGILIFGLLRGAGAIIKQAILDESDYWEPKVARVLIKIAGWVVPSHSEEWHAELDVLQERGKASPGEEESPPGSGEPVIHGVTWALGVLFTAPLTGLLARVRRFHTRDRSQPLVRLGGGGTAVIVRTGAAAAALTMAGALATILVFRSGAPPVHSSGAPPPHSSDQLPLNSPTWTEQENLHYPSKTFGDYHTVSADGPAIPAGATVEVACKLKDPSISSVAPDGYWYKVTSPPWNNAYWTPANNFLNGDPYNGPYSRNTDWAVPDC